MYKCVYRCGLCVSINLVLVLLATAGTSFAGTVVTTEKGPVLASYVSIQESKSRSSSALNGSKEVSVVELTRPAPDEFELTIRLESGAEATCFVHFGEEALVCDSTEFSRYERHSVEESLLPVRYFLARNFVYQLEFFGKWVSCRFDVNEEDCGEDLFKQSCENESLRHSTLSEFGVLVSDRQRSLRDGVLVSDFGVLVSDLYGASTQRIDARRIESCEAPEQVVWSAGSYV